MNCLFLEHTYIYIYVCVTRLQPSQRDRYSKTGKERWDCKGELYFVISLDFKMSNLLILRTELSIIEDGFPR